MTSQPSQKPLLFVYGTLKTNLRNHHLLSTSQCLGEHLTNAEFTLYNCGRYPVVVHSGNTQVKGEIYAVDDETLVVIDRLERHPDWYHRIVINTSFGDAFIYIMNEEDVLDKPSIDNGVWDIC